MSGELKPCPFCGSATKAQEGEYGYTIWIGCPNPICSIGPSRQFHGEAEAISAWNTRTPPAGQSPEVTGGDGGEVTLALDESMKRLLKAYPSDEPLPDEVCGPITAAHAGVVRGLIHDNAELRRWLSWYQQLVASSGALLIGAAGEAEAAISSTDGLKTLPPPTRQDGEGEESGWQPIETAPKDGTVIDLLIRGQRSPDAYWGRPEHTCGEAGQYCDSCPSHDGWVDSTFMHYLNGEDGSWGEEPTHWRPLPAPPLSQPSVKI